MAPNKSFRTYSRRDHSSVSSMEAFNILFAKNLTQRKLYGKTHKGKNKIKLGIKELPTKIKTVLNDESSLRVNVNDTFDNLLKDPLKNTESDDIKVKVVANKSSYSVIKHLSSFNIVSPMLQKLRSYDNKSATKNALDSWFNEPTPPGERITNMLEIENIVPDRKNASKSKKSSRSESNRSSPIFLRSHMTIPSKSSISVGMSNVTNCSIAVQNFSKETKDNEEMKRRNFSNQNFNFNPIFTNSVREHILIHSSTPVVPRKKQHLIGQPISPINNRDEIQNCIIESLEEIKSWNSSLPKLETVDNKGNDSKSNNLLMEPLQTLSFNLEDFEGFFEHLKRNSLKTEKIGQKDINFEDNSITVDDFENFHKKFISCQLGNQRKLIKGISLKEFESFYESYQKKISFCKDSFFDSHKSINFVTHRKHKLSLNPKAHQNSGSSKKFNLRDLVVVLDNNLMNYSGSRFKKLEEPGCAVMNSVNKKQLTVRLTRLSLDKLKLTLNQTPPLFKAKSKQTFYKFKACRKFSSNWSTRETSRTLPNNNIKISITGTISDLSDKSNLKYMTTKSFGNISNDKTKFHTNLSGRYYSDTRKTVQLQIEGTNNKSEKKHNSSRILTGQSKESRMSCPAILNSSRFDISGKKLYNTFSSNESKSEMHYLTTSKIKNVCHEISDEHDSEQLLIHSGLCKSVVKRKRELEKQEKQYIAKILVASTTDTSIEIQERNKYPGTISEYSPKTPMLVSLNNRRLRSFTRRSCHAHLNIGDQQNASITKICKSSTNITYFAQDLSDSILLNSNTSPSPSKSGLRGINSPLTPSRSFMNQSIIPATSVSLRSSDRRRKNENSKSYKAENGTTQSLEESASAIQHMDYSIDSNRSERLDQIADSVFKVPMINDLNQKPPNIKAGKLWRRSLMQHKRKSFIDLTQNSCYESIINNLILSECSRQSVKILPSDETNRLRRRTALQTYVYLGMGVNESATDVIKPIPRKLTFEKPSVLITARDMVLKYCGQTDPVPFEKMYTKSLLKDCKKIGEGVYGEVFVYSRVNGNTTVMKVIPIEGDKIVNGERQKKFHEILSEVAIVSQLSNLRNNVTNKTSAFCDVQRICCVRGKYPKILLDAWYDYDRTKSSENDPPDLFDCDQLYIVLDLGNGGQDLEAFIFNNAAQAVAMFKQVAYALAVGEEHLQFEHRDLHWGNILLRTVDKNKKVVFKHKGQVKECHTQGVEVTIIDFTLSRIAHDGVVIFNDLGMDPELFLAEGDYQFDIYRLMKEKNTNDWKKFTPYSNILWLHYVLRKSITALRYKNTKTKIHKKCIQSLKKYENDILNFTCVSEFVDECL